MKTLKRILVGTFVVIAITILYMVLDIATHNVISTGIMKYIANVLFVSVAVLVACKLDKRMR